MPKLNDTHILDSREEMDRLDKSNLLSSIEALADQAKHAWESTQSLKVSFKNEIKNIVVASMGGSSFGASIVKHLFFNELNVPIEICSGYSLPSYIDKHTLVIPISFSGGTEETLNCLQQAKTVKASIFIITAGGKLAEIASQERYPIYLIKDTYNPSHQGRMAIGYIILGFIGVLVKSGLLKISQDKIEEIITTIIRTSEKLSPETEKSKNQAKLLAFSCVERRPILVGSEFLAGSLHVATNQLNENAKLYADYKVVPELNHYLMEGLQFPKNNSGNHIFIFFDSLLYLPRNQQRMKLTQEVVEKNEIDTLDIELISETKISQVFELITLMSYASFYVSMLEGINPSPIPFVDWFKDELGKA